LKRRTFLSSSLALAAGRALPAVFPFSVNWQREGFRLEEATIASIHQAVSSGILTTERLVELYLARIEAYDFGAPRLASVLAVNPRALDDARALDRERRARGPRGRLHGIPVLLKDNVDTVDMPTSNGSWVLRKAMAPDDAFITKALRDAGAVILGKAAMGEFAGGSYNSVRGQTINPYHLKRNTGGSSSGSGAAIAANLAVLAVGTDTSTSVRGPAAYNGLVGLRPTTGLISRDGIAPKNLNFDTAGPMARTVTDLAQMLSVIGAPDGGADPLNATVWGEIGSQGIDYSTFLDEEGLRGARLGVVRDFFGGDPEIDALAEAALRTLEGLGAQLVEVTLPQKILDTYLGRGGQTIRRISDHRFRADWEAYLRTLGGDVPRTVADFIRVYETEVMGSAAPVEASVMRLLRDSLETSVDDPAYRQLLGETLPMATRDKLALFSEHGVDALVFPYESAFASPIRNPIYSLEDPTYVGSDRTVSSIFAGYSSVGFPGIVVPMGFGGQGLPMALSFFGRPYEEGRLIQYAFAYEQASGLRRPSPLVPPLNGEEIG
jgi:amidase